MGSSLKLNLMTFYMEYQFAFKKHPHIGPPDGSLTPEELSALVAFVKPRQLDILGNQQSFGHFGRILQHPEFAALRETAEVLTPVRDETHQLLDDLYSEVCPLLPFPWFNVCCDETWGLGTGPSRELAAKKGKRMNTSLTKQTGRRGRNRRHCRWDSAVASGGRAIIILDRVGLLTLTRQDKSIQRIHSGGRHPLAARR